MAKFNVSFHTTGRTGGEYNIAVTAETPQQAIAAATAKANHPLRRLNRLDAGLGTQPTVTRLR